MTHKEEGPKPPGDEEPADDTDQRTHREPSAGVPWRLAVFLVLAVAIVVFAVQNTQAVELRLLGWTWQLPLVIIILIAVVLSVLLDEILGGLFKRRRRRRRHEREELRRLRGDSRSSR